MIETSEPTSGPAQEMNSQQEQAMELMQFSELLRTLDVSVLRNLPAIALDWLRNVLEEIAENFDHFHVIAFIGEPGSGKKSLLFAVLFFIKNYHALLQRIEEVKKRRGPQQEDLPDEQASPHEVEPVVFRFTMGILTAKAMGLVETTKTIPDYDDEDLQKVSLILSLVLSILADTLPVQYPNKTHIALLSVVGIDPRRDTGRTTLKSLGRNTHAYAVGVVGDARIRQKALTERQELKTLVKSGQGAQKITGLGQGTVFDEVTTVGKFALYNAPPETMLDIREGIIQKILKLQNPDEGGEGLQTMQRFRLLDLEVDSKKTYQAIGMFMMYILRQNGFNGERSIVTNNSFIEGIVVSDEETLEPVDHIMMYNALAQEASALHKFFSVFVEAGNRVRAMRDLSPLSEDVVRKNLDSLLNNVPKSANGVKQGLLKPFVDLFTKITHVHVDDSSLDIR